MEDDYPAFLDWLIRKQPSYAGVILRNGKLEGILTLLPSPSSSRVEGTLVSPELDAFVVAVDPFLGGSPELAELACRLLGFEYQFPSGIGVTPVDFVWTKRPSQP